MRSSNPSLKDSTFSKLRGQGIDRPMTLQGTVNKTFILLVLLCAGAFYTWNQYFDGKQVAPLLLAGVIGAFIVSLITIFVPKASPFLAPLYAMLEGLALGGISAMYEAKFSGITTQAVLLTFSVLFALLIVYKLGLIKVTKNFRLGVMSATLGVALVYLVDLVLRLFGLNVPFIHETGVFGIIISLVIVGVAALNLVLDFDFIERGVEQRAPKYMEWYAGFGLMLTLVWLYLEMLRLLSKIKN
ncbi:Bax inhibitor-1/YccA family protein [Fictibacillus sp. KU28468]|uniref:Bax inhibitor-1/YccA family protein n=1 Tax=Fictibacillus sp. KU28468 TaxID=2991053 RepID=UPI00223C9E0E|nr:Bax inhibitor-1/YccA family protein [Fictibacillus sp. KU28468]UZJ79462.1 Bax inhibitor-1/YccA family protein [Fictibacillus sp. KU28468]